MPPTDQTDLCPDLADQLRQAREEYERRTSAPTDRRLTSQLGVESFWAAEEMMLETYSEFFQQAGCITEVSHLKNIVDWKTNGRAVHLVEKNLDSREPLRSISERAFQCVTSQEAIATLTELPGVGVPVATAILMFANPVRYTVMDPRATTALRTIDDRYDVGGWMGPTKATADHYADYCLVCQELSQRAGLSLRDVDRALFVLGGD